MRVSHRTYESKLGTVREFPVRDEKTGRCRSKHLGSLVGSFITEIGISGAAKISPIAPSVALRWRPLPHHKMLVPNSHSPTN